MPSCSPANRDGTSVGGRSIRVQCHAECSLSQLRKGFRSPDSNIRVVRRSTSASGLLGSTYRRCAVRALEGMLRIPSTFVSQDSKVPQRQQFGPKTERANVVVGPQLCAGVPDIHEIPLSVCHRKR